MKNAANMPERLLFLVHTACTSEISGAEVRELEAMLLADPESRRFYSAYCRMHAELLFFSGERRVTEIAGDAVRLQASVCPWTVPSQTQQGMTDAFLQSWSVAYVVATVILGIGLLIGAFTHVSRPVPTGQPSPTAQRPPISESPMQFVGRITGMVDCQWSGRRKDEGGRMKDELPTAGNGIHPSSFIPHPSSSQSLVSLGDKFALSSGLMEISYDTGAKVILQGPCMYEVESASGGLLSVGKLTARVEKNEERRTKNEELSGSRSSFLIPRSYFAVRTPTAIVTDLGTEFGVEVSETGSTTSHVFRGSVSLRAASVDGQPEPVARVLHENESARVETMAGSSGSGPRLNITSLTASPVGFVREISKRLTKTLDLVDVVAGGDGFSGRQNRGIDPNSGEIVDHAPPENAQWNQIRSDGRYHRVERLPYIDGVFVPDDRREPVQLDSAGHTFTRFGNSDDRVFGLIWAGGEIPVPILPAMRTQLGAIDYASPDHRALGMIANKGITFDLEAIRRGNPGCKIVKFLAVAGNTEPQSSEDIWYSVDIWVFVDGEIRFSKVNVNNANGIAAFPVNVAIRDTNRFLTLVASDAGNTITSDRVILGDPRLELTVSSDAQSSVREAPGK